MKNKLLLTVLAILVFSFGFSQNSLWTKVSEERINANEKLGRTSFPSEYQLFRLDFQALKNQLKAAPSREGGGISNLIISFPNAEGKLEKYRVYESSVMEVGLAEKHPEIQSYIGKGIDNSTAKIHFTTTIFGLHTMTLSDNGAFYIDPYTKDLQNYIVYNKANLTTTSRSFECLVKDTEENFERTTMGAPQSTFASDGVFRTYRLAMACTTEYASYHISQAGLNAATLAVKKAAVLAAMNITVSRINSVYENDMSLRMVLVANNDQIIFVTSDSFNNNNAEVLIGQSQDVIDSVIGFDNYDIGHTVSTGGGGLAASPSVCTGSKAMGITGSFAPVGDPYDIDYVAHEVGHQFGASHTFNGTGGSCTGNRASLYAVEPGSGSTIMAYAGICNSNVQNNSDAYFHAVSIAQMVSHITGFEGGCVEGVANGNTPPSIATLSNYTIPKGTAFVLRGSATDVDGDDLTYCWEQTNRHNTNTSNPSPLITESIPNFRSFMPTSSPNRYFPALSRIVANNLVSTWEAIPNVGRTMSFALTVRDNNSPNGGQTDRKNMNVTFNAAAGPFTVTSQSAAGITWTNTPQTITWNVASTNVAPINTANVNILLSTDGGLTFPITLVANTPNDGSQVIATIPNVNSTTCRIMIEAVNNIFIAVNTTAFSINNALSTENFGLKDFKLYPNPNTGNFNVEFNSETSNDINIAIYDISGRQIFNKVYPNTGGFLQNLQLNNVQSGVYLVNINDGDKKEIRKIIID